MRVHTRSEMVWDNTLQKYVITYEEGFDYNGPVAKCCGGASDEQKQAFKDQSNLFATLRDQATTVFGNASKVFQQLFKTFSPIVEAGPSQRGMSAPEKAALKSAAITNSGQAYKNAKAAVGNALAAQGGGNEVLPGGADIGIQTSLANSAAENTANQLNTIEQRDWDIGRGNFQMASAALGGAPGVFSTAQGFGSNAVNAAAGEAQTGAEITQANNSWMNMVGGILGGVGGAFVGGMMNKGAGGKSGGGGNGGGTWV